MELQRTTHHLFEGDPVAFFDGGQQNGTARTGRVIEHIGDEVTINGDDGKRYHVPRRDIALRSN
ncbi:MAG: hypothetical protein WCE30_21800 [Mycobacterium sp.]